jgi:N-acylneuraminate cytidylyltransferase
MAVLNGKPLLQRAIESAIESKIINRIVVSSDWDECLELAGKMAVDAIRRPPELCLDSSHDFEFVCHALERYPDYDIFMILRPTSPFRTADTIRRAMDLFLSEPRCDSLRAVEPTRAHPRKSWTMAADNRIVPYGKIMVGVFPGYDLSTQALGSVYCQNGCIHVAWVDTLRKFWNVSGDHIKGYVTRGNEGIDINMPDDLAYAEWIMKGKS